MQIGLLYAKTKDKVQIFLFFFGWGNAEAVCRSEFEHIFRVTKWSPFSIISFWLLMLIWSTVSLINFPNFCSHNLVI